MAVRTCTKCGEDNKEEVLNCTACGSSLRDSKLIGLKDSEKQEIILNSDDLTRCSLCKCEDVEEGYQINLCKECRQKLIYRKIPLKIKAAAVLVAVIMILSFLKFPESIHTGSVYYKGMQLYKARDYNNALECFKEIRNGYPDSNEITGWIALTYLANKNFTESSTEFKKLPQKNLHISTELEKEMESIFSKLMPSKEAGNK